MPGKKMGKRKMVRRNTVQRTRRRFRHLEGVTTIDASDYEFIRRFLTEHGKIVPSRLTGASARQQRAIKRGVRRARVMGLVP